MRKRWETKILGDVLLKTETTDPTRSPSTEFDYIDVSSVSNETLTIQETQRLMGKNAPSRARRLVRANDVLFATIRPTLRRIAIVPEDLDGQVCSTGYFVLRANRELDFRFLFYFLQTQDFISQMEILQKGASYPAVNDGDVRSQPIPLPPLEEQQRIVSILDEAFAGLASAQAHAARNLQNARALFESHLQAVFTQRGEGWVGATLADVLFVLRNGLNCKQDKSGVGTKISRIESIWNSRFDIARVGYAKISQAQKSKFLLRKGDVLFSHINSAIHVGKTALFDLEDEVVHGVNLLLMRTKPFVLPAYLDLYLKYLFITGYWLRISKQSINQASVNQQDINRVPFYYPKMEPQLEIVKQLDVLSAETQHLTRIYEQKLAALAALKKSLLHQAFSGEL